VNCGKTIECIQMYIQLRFAFFFGIRFPSVCVYTRYRQGRFLPKNSGGGGIAPISPFITESIFSVLRNRKIRTSYGPTLKSVISKVANSVLCWTLRPVETKPRRPTVGVGFLAGVASPSVSARWSRGLGRSPGKFGFWSILGPQKSCQNAQLAFES